MFTEIEKCLLSIRHTDDEECERGVEEKISIQQYINFKQLIWPAVDTKIYLPIKCMCVCVCATVVWEKGKVKIAFLQMQTGIKEILVSFGK